MKAEITYTNADGMRLTSVDEARRHAEAVYGNVLSSLVHKLIRLDNKYLALHEFIEANLDEFAALKARYEDATTVHDLEGKLHKWDGKHWVPDLDA